MIATFNIMLLALVTIVIPFHNCLLLSLRAIATGQARLRESRVIKVAKSEEAVTETVKRVVDKLFGERQPQAVFEQYFLFSALSSDQQDVVDETTSLFYSQKYAGLDEKTVARIFAAKWSYEYQPALLVIGTKRLSTSESFRENLEQADSDIEKQRKRVLSEHKIREDEFFRLLDVDSVRDLKTLEHNLTVLEQIDSDITRFIERKTNQSVLAGNIAKMQEGLFVNKHSVGDRMFYEIQLKPMFKMVFLQQVAAVKMIAFGDVL